MWNTLLELLGPNHPTMKWFAVHAKLEPLIMSDIVDPNYVCRVAVRLLAEDDAKGGA